MATPAATTLRTDATPNICFVTTSEERARLAQAELKFVPAPNNMKEPVLADSHESEYVYVRFDNLRTLLSCSPAATATLFVGKSEATGADHQEEQQPQRITEVPLLWGRIPMAVPAEFWVAAMAKWNLMPVQKRADYIRDNMLSGCGHDPAKSPSS